MREMASSSLGRQLAVGYRVFIDDNFAYQNEAERIAHGEFETAHEALAACHFIVGQFLDSAFEPGMTAAALYERYVSFGDDPFIVPPNSKDPSVTFSAWEYARDRCEVIAT